MKLFEKFKKSARACIRTVKTKGAAFGAAGALTVGGLGTGLAIESQSDEFQKALNDGAKLTDIYTTAANAHLPGGVDRAAIDLLEATRDQNYSRAVSILNYHPDDFEYSDLGQAYVDAVTSGNMDVIKLLDETYYIPASAAIMAMSSAFMENSLTPDATAHIIEIHGDYIHSDLIEGFFETGKWNFLRENAPLLAFTAKHYPHSLPYNILPETLEGALKLNDLGAVKNLLETRGDEITNIDLMNATYLALEAKNFAGVRTMFETAPYRFDQETSRYALRQISFRNAPDTLRVILEKAGSQIDRLALLDAVDYIMSENDVESAQVLFTSATAMTLTYQDLNYAKEVSESYELPEMTKIVDQAIRQKTRILRGNSPIVRGY